MTPAGAAPKVDMAAFVVAARKLARSIGTPAHQLWLGQYEEGLVAAQAQGDPLGLAEMAHFAAVRLDTDGLHSEAIAQTAFALSFVGEDASSVALLRSLRGFYEALAGDAAAARVSLAVAEAAVKTARPQRTRLEGAVICAVTHALLLDEASDEGLRALIRKVRRTPFDWQLSGLLSWLVPLLVALGDPVGASPWVRALAALAGSAAHPWRQADAAIFRLAIEQRNDCTAVPGVEVGKNYLAGWRQALLRLHGAVRHRDSAEAQRALGALDALRGNMHAGFTDGFAVAEAIAGARHAADGESALPPPAHVSLTNLELVLAGAEHVAVHGDQASATEWTACLSNAVPREVRTALAWPVARDRVEGLLRIRTGDVRGGLASLRAAVRWCDSAGYVVEGGLARLQLAEVTALSDRPGTARQLRVLRSQAIETLERHGMDPVAPAYAATRAFSSGRGASGALLAPREVQVLRLLADGMTYREAADTLGVQWRTVQTHAYHAYSKLGVSRRLAAVETARRLGII